MNARNLKVGQQVYWNDPAEETSGVYTVRRTGLEDADTSDYEEDDYDDIIVFCTNEAGGELECFAHELSIYFDPRKPHEKLPLPDGTEHEEIVIN